jgi:hypothetical protein
MTEQRMHINPRDTRRSPAMPTDTSLHALQDASPRNQPAFDEWLERLDTLRTQITATPVPARRRLPHLDRRHRVIGLSAAAAAALAAAAVVVGLTLGAASPRSAYAAAKKALAATAAASSGTITGTVSHDGSSGTLDTTRWNGDSIAVTRGDVSAFGPGQALTLINGGAYVEQADGTWLHYASASGVGPKLGPMVELAQNNVAGNTADQILSLATGLAQSSQLDGTTVYTGTIPNLNADRGGAATDDTILRIIEDLRTGNDAIGPHKWFAPAGFHNGLQLQMTVGPDGFVRQIVLTFQQQDTGSPASDGTYTWTVTYTQLGATPPITAPATSTPTPPVIWSPGTACSAPCGG